ncbi:hypothetical protein Scep_025320 [Stephania cephalantha]|uniref:Protein kinase domain-containing protein n=1 Tax=Stephania cephalantha TaxID=152367 RepID=A0AAP0EI18_9MAGN
MKRSASERKTFSTSREEYELLEEIGQGASATVYRAIYRPTNEVVAVKCLDLERCNSNLENIQKEAQIMSLMNHPNLVTSYCSFVVDRCLWVIMPFMAEGSCLHLMKYGYPDGLKESTIGYILKETLKALDYLHRHGHIHRDVKAGNILIDSDGMVKLADFGVSACMFDNGDRRRARNTFIGTPCWMAPEVMQQDSGYDFKADIWSFGITALELAHGHAPFSKFPPMKVLLMTLQNAPPGLDYDRDKKFSKSFKEMIGMCLVKDQKKRPTAEKLLKHSFFKKTKSPGPSVKKVLLDLPPLGDRVKIIQLKDAAQLASKEVPSAEQEAMSQSEYKRSVSGWNFDVEDLKLQASLIPDDEDDITGAKDEDQTKRLAGEDVDASSSSSGFGRTTSFIGVDCRESTSGSETSTAECLNQISDFGDKEYVDGNGCSEAALQGLEKITQVCLKSQNNRNCRAPNGLLMPDREVTRSLSEKDVISKRCENNHQEITDKSRHTMRKVPSFNSQLMLPNQASANNLSAPSRFSGGSGDALEDGSKVDLVQKKGRFSVTSENVDFVTDPSMKRSSSFGAFLLDSKQGLPGQSSKAAQNGSAPASLASSLQCLLKQTSALQDLIAISLNNLERGMAADGPTCSALQKGKPTPESQSSENVGDTSDGGRRQLLLSKISEFQSRMNDLTVVLTTENLMQMKLQEQPPSAPICQTEEKDQDQQKECNNQETKVD